MKLCHRDDSKQRVHYVEKYKSKLDIKPHLLYAGKLLKQPGFEETMHSHDFFEVMFVKNGKGQVIVEDKTIPIEKNCIVMYNAGVLHREISSETDPLELTFIGVEDLDLPNLERNCMVEDKFNCILRCESYSKMFERYFDEIIIETDKCQLFHSDIILCLTKIILTLIFRILTYGTDNYLHLNETFAKCKEYIDNNFTKDIMLENVCESIYVSKSYLSNLFKEYEGMPPIKYMISKRINLAKTLLSTTNQTISKVANNVGYADTNYFLKVFKNVTSFTPQEFRRASKLASKENSTTPPLVKPDDTPK